MSHKKTFGHYLWVNAQVQYVWIAGILFVMSMIGSIAGAPYPWMGGGLVVLLGVVQPLIGALQHWEHDDAVSRAVRKATEALAARDELQEKFALFQVPLQQLVDSHLNQLRKADMGALNDAKYFANQKPAEGKGLGIRQLREYEEELRRRTKAADDAQFRYQSTKTKYERMGFKVSEL